MSKMRIAITIDERLLERIDNLVAQKRFSSRNSAFQHAVQAQVERLDRNRLEGECAKLDRKKERVLAEAGAAWDLEGWPEYSAGGTS